jgi:hypothetical protein
MRGRRDARRWLQTARQRTCGPDRPCPVQAAHFVIENAGVSNVNGGRTRSQRLLNAQHNHFFVFFGCNLRRLRGTAAGDADLVEVDVDRIQRDLRGRIEHSNRDGFIAFKFGLVNIWSEREFIVLGPGNFRQSLRGRQRECEHDKGHSCKDALHGFPSGD